MRPIDASFEPKQPRPPRLERLQASSTARAKKAKSSSNDDKKIAELVENALSMGVAISVLRKQHEAYKDEGRRVAKRKGVKDHRAHLLIMVDVKDTRYMIDCSPQFEYTVDRDKFIQLVGLERAAICMELMAYTHLCNLADAGQLRRQNGTHVTEGEIKKITKKCKRPVMKVTFEKQPLLSSAAYEQVMHPQTQKDDDE